MTRTYSSIREAMQYGIFDQQVAAAAEEHRKAQDPKASSTAAQRRASHTAAMRRRSQSSLASAGSSSSSQPGSRSFTAGIRRPSYRPDRRVSSIIDEDDALECDVDDSSHFLATAKIFLSPSPSPPEEIDVSQLGKADLEKLRKEDPFAYFSIPRNNARELRALDDEDTAQEQGPRGRRQQRRMSQSLPAGMLADADIARAAFEGNLDDDTDDFNASSVSVVSRRSRLSCEAHPSLVFYDGLVDEDANIDDNMDEEENMLLRALMGED